MNQPSMDPDDAIDTAKTDPLIDAAEVNALRQENATLKQQLAQAKEEVAAFRNAVKSADRDLWDSKQQLAQAQAAWRPEKHSGDCQWWANRICDCGYLRSAQFDVPTEGETKDWVIHLKNCDEAKRLEAEATNRLDRILYLEGEKTMRINAEKRCDDLLARLARAEKELAELKASLPEIRSKAVDDYLNP